MSEKKSQSHDLIHNHDHDHEDGCQCGHDHASALDHLDHHHGSEFNLVGETKASIEKVWSYLTVNKKLDQWFPGLSYEDQVAPGHYLHVIGKDGQVLERNLITDVTPSSYLAFMWGVYGSSLAFTLRELGPEMTEISLTQWVYDLNDQVAVDLAVWHVALQDLGAVLEGGKSFDRQKEIQKVLPEVQNLLKEAKVGQDHHHHDH